MSYTSVTPAAITVHEGTRRGGGCFRDGRNVGGLHSGGRGTVVSRRAALCSQRLEGLGLLGSVFPA